MQSRQLLAEKQTSALQPRTDGTLGNAQDGADLAGVEFGKGGKSERHAEFFRQCVDHGVNHGLLVGKDQVLLGAGPGRGRVAGRVGIGGKIRQEMV